MLSSLSNQPALFLQTQDCSVQMAATTGHTSLPDPLFNPSVVLSHFADEEKEVTSSWDRAKLFKEEVG